MLVVTVELWPFGNESRKVEIARGEIWNKGNGGQVTDYGASFFEDQNDRLNIPKLYVHADVDAHDRKQTVWSLVRKALVAAKL